MVGANAPKRRESCQRLERSLLHRLHPKRRRLSLVVSYATSPAAEVHYSKGKYSTPPTGNLFLKGGTFRQVEGAAVLKGAKQPELAAKLVSWLQSGEVQKALPAEMWVYPAVKNTPLPKVFEFAQTPKHSDSPNRADINTQTKTMG